MFKVTWKSVYECAVKLDVQVYSAGPAVVTHLNVQHYAMMAIYMLEMIYIIKEEDGKYLHVVHRFLYRLGKHCRNSP